MKQKIKTYVITLSKVFPVTHKRAGKPTEFKEAFLRGQRREAGGKVHTIRANYDLWEKRIKEVQAGRAVIDIRQWSGKPYHSKQEFVKVLTAGDGVGIQKLTFERGNIYNPKVDGQFRCSVVNLATYDGLTCDDWEKWFKDYDLTKPLAIIHFTNYRY